MSRMLKAVLLAFVAASLVVALLFVPSLEPARSCAAEGDDDPKDHRENGSQIDLDIFHGQFGSMLSEDQEDDKHGATTVANQNDTDADGTIDNADNMVKTAGTSLSVAAVAGGTSLTVQSLAGFSVGTTIMLEEAANKPWKDKKWEVVQILSIHSTEKVLIVDALQNSYVLGDKVYKPEVDLMKIVLRKPNPDHGGNVTLSKLDGDIKIWEKPTKETEVTLPMSLATSELEKTLWVEARAPSTGLRDIILKLEYEGSWDIVKATAVWVDKTARPLAEGSNPWAKRQAADGFPDNPVPGAGGNLPNLTTSYVVQKINNGWGGPAAGFRAQDGSRYGHGFCAKQNGSDQFYGGRILLEFKVQPNGAEALGVVYDCSRQRHFHADAISSGSSSFHDLLHDVFPWLASPLRDADEPNDDDAIDDEQDMPLHQLIYAYDAPSASVDPYANAFMSYRATFKEWVRVHLEDKSFANKNNLTEGSRASDKADWHCVFYLKRATNGNWEEDSASPSYSAPVFTGGTERGAIAVTLLADADTDGYTVTYNAGNKTWTLSQSSNGATASDTREPGDGATWTMIIGTRIKVEITQNGGAAYANGDKYTFSVFKSGKKNETGTGFYDVPVDP